MGSFEISYKNSQPVFSIGNDSDPKEVWICCHGYGQTAKDLVEVFEEIDSKQKLFLFPESLSRFYKRGHRGDVGGSWMTRYHRLLDIKNQNAYLDSVWNYALDNFPKASQIGFGFSQGGATIARWADHNPDAADELILWGCKFPPDLEDEELQNYRKDKLVKIFIGDQDEFFPTDEISRLKEKFSGLKNLEWINYSGEHKIYPEILESLM